jgi:dienelactone hydrolase
VTKLFASTALVASLLLGSAIRSLAAAPEASGTVVELETPLGRTPPLQGYLRRPEGVGPSPAVVLLHSCNGNWRRLDERWGPRIARWGYVTLAVDSFETRGIKSTCSGGGPVDMSLDAYRALAFLVKQPFVDPAHVAVVGFSQGGRIALTSVERGIIEHTSQNKFQAAVAFYPPCSPFKDDMTVPTLIMVGELDDWTPAQECRNIVEGIDGYGIARQKGQGVPIKLIVYPGAFHAFDAPALKTPIDLLGHHLEYNQAAADQSAVALHEFLDATIGEKEHTK